jgi:hypothetical protein
VRTLCKTGSWRFAACVPLAFPALNVHKHFQAFLGSQAKKAAPWRLSGFNKPHHTNPKASFRHGKQTKLKKVLVEGQRAKRLCLPD